MQPATWRRTGPRPQPSEGWGLRSHFAPRTVRGSCAPRGLRLATLLVGLLAGFVHPHASWAQEDKKAYSVRPDVYERLLRAQTALKKNKFADAKKEIRILRKRMKPNPHELALGLQTLGYVYAAEEKILSAANVLREAYEQNALPAATQLGLLYNIGQLYMAAEKYPLAVAALDRWVAQEKKPSPDALYLVAAAKYKNKDLRGCAKYAERAVSSSRNPKDGWLQLLLSSYIELKRYRPAIKIMTVLVERHPDRRSNWLQLVSLYGEVNDEKRALAVLQLAYEAGVFNKREDYIQLAQRLRSGELNYQAGKFLEGVIGKGKLSFDPVVGKHLGLAWFAAREHKKAAPSLAKAAKMAKDGKLYVQLSQLHLERERWAQAADAGRKALRKGGLKNPAKVHLLIGIAEARRGRPARAREAFEIAAKTPSVRRSAKGWLNYLSSARTGLRGASASQSPK